MDIVIGAIYSIIRVLSFTWWIFLPIILIPLFHQYWLVYMREKFIRKLKWSFLEIKVPKDILKTPKAMEQVFSAMYGNYSHGIKTVYKYTEGHVDLWFSFEMVGYSGGVHFYVVVPEKLRNLVESAIFSEYPDAEIHETEDYTDLLPRSMPNKTYELWGTQFEFKKESCYPLRTHQYFEDSIDERRIDPISAIIEMMSNLKGDERLWAQITICPSDFSEGNMWKEEGDEIINKIVGRPAEKKKSFSDEILSWVRNLFQAPVAPPVWDGAEKPTTPPMIKFLSPAEQEIVKAIDNKIAKLGFETNFRFMYIDKRETFSTANVSAFMGTIRQFNTQNLNAIRPSKSTRTLVTGWKSKFIPYYQHYMEFAKKKSLWFSYKQRRCGNRLIDYYRNYGEKMMTMNVEELATLYHFPITFVMSPKLRRLESKKGGPPPSLPIED